MSRRKTSLTDTVITSCQIRCKNKIACLIRNSIPKGLCCIWWHSNVIIYYSVCTSWVGFQHLTGTWSNKPPPTQTFFFFNPVFGPNSQFITPEVVTSASAHGLLYAGQAPMHSLWCTFVVIRWSGEVVLWTVAVTQLCHSSWARWLGQIIMTLIAL